MKKGSKQTEKTKQKIRNSMKCYEKTEEHRKNISLAKKGIPVTEDEKNRLRNLTKGIKHTEKAILNITKGNIGKNKGKKRTEEQNKINSERRKDEYVKGKLPWNKGLKGIFIRELAANWQGGKSFEEYGIEFNKELKDYIKQRDMYMCQTPNCMNTENLHVHHIDYDKKNNNIDNLITLCINCHVKTNGKKDRFYWAVYYSEIRSIYL